LKLSFRIDLARHFVELCPIGEVCADQDSEQEAQQYYHAATTWAMKEKLPAAYLYYVEYSLVTTQKQTVPLLEEANSENTELLLLTSVARVVLQCRPASSKFCHILAGICCVLVAVTALVLPPTICLWLTRR
jgi:hypothetical protein